MNKIHFTLGKTLNEMNISRYKLASESKVRPNTIKDMVSNQSKSVTLTTLTAILEALNKIADEQGIDRFFDIEDVFIYKK